MEKLVTNVPIKFLVEPSKMQIQNSQEVINNQAAGGNKAVDFWRIYFFLNYFLGVCPFRLTKVYEGQGVPQQQERLCFTTASWLPQKLICIIFTISALFGILGELRLSIPKNSKNPTSYFQMSQTIAFSIGKLLILKRCWFDEDRLLKLVNFINSSKNGNLHSSKIIKRIISSKYLYLIICFVYFTNEIGYYFVGLDAGTSGSRFSSAQIWQNMVNDAKFNFLFQSIEVGINANATSGNQDELVFGILACVGYFQRFSRIVLGSFDNMYVLAVILTLWTMTHSFVEYLESEHGISGGIGYHRDFDIFTVKNHNEALKKLDGWWPTFFGRYTALRRATDEINQMFGVNVGMVLIETIVFFAIALDSLFIVSLSGNPDYLRSIVACIVIFVVCGCCILSADVASQMEKVKYRLSLPENRKSAPKEELYFVLKDLDDYYISIKGANIYPITWTLLANAAATAITYFIICVQIQS